MTMNDPIAAISTPYGRGGIAVIRICGEGAIKIAEAFFKPSSDRKLSEYKSGSCAYGRIYNEGCIIDDGIATVFRAPHSYTGEETVEISCHGGIVLSELVLSSALSAGCRMAEAGEFTKRAFLNGKISLTQAEGVIGLIDAVSEESVKINSAQSRGVLLRECDRVRDSLVELIASVYAYIDYPDEDLTDMSVSELKSRSEQIINELERLRATYKTGRAVCEGIMTVIVGKPNTGKSSVLNRLLGKERAIVTDVAGTTRDTLEENLTIGKISLRLCDTAGIHDTDDIVEKIGVKRAKDKLDEAELILAIFDGSIELSEEDRDVISSISDARGKVIPIINKTDKGCTVPREVMSLGEPICVSALSGEGFDSVVKKITELYISEEIDYNKTAVLTNVRQYSAVSAAAEHVRNALTALNNGMTQDMAGMDLELAVSSLGEVDGRTAAAEITDRIFSRFCVGK